MTGQRQWYVRQKLQVVRATHRRNGSRHGALISLADAIATHVQDGDTVALEGHAPPLRRRAASQAQLRHQRRLDKKPHDRQAQLLPGGPPHGPGRSYAAKAGQSQTTLFRRCQAGPDVPPDLEVHLILDNYATYKTEVIKRWLACHPRFHLQFIS